MSPETTDPKLAWALARYQAISPYLAEEPPRGQRRVTLRRLAARVWTGPDGEPWQAAAETLRVWVRRYRKHGLDGLRDRPRSAPGLQKLTAEQVELLCRLKEEVPERSLERIICIAEATGLVEPGVLRRSTVHRALRARGLSARKARVPDDTDLDRFEDDQPNGLWHSDLLVGPWLPDPDRPGKMRRAVLYAFLDDHSRLLLHGRFSFREHLPALELVFRRALQRWGVPRRVYYDNALVYHAVHMRAVVATLGLHRIVYTRPHRPMGHGKIEAFNRLVRAAFIAELKTARITTLDALNEAWGAWVELAYNHQVHGETGATPLDRWRAGVDRVRYADEEVLRQAFLWTESRTPDKTGVFSLLGIAYQVGPELARRRIQVRFDPEDRAEVEVWLRDRFVQRCRPLEIHPFRRPRPVDPEPLPRSEAEAPPTADWIGHLVRQRRTQGTAAPEPRALHEERQAARAADDDALLALLHDRLPAGVLDEPAARAWLDRYGPLDPEIAEVALDRLLAHGQPADQHVTVLLDALRVVLQGDPR